MNEAQWFWYKENCPYRQVSPLQRSLQAEFRLFLWWQVRLLVKVVLRDCSDGLTWHGLNISQHMPWQWCDRLTRDQYKTVQLKFAFKVCSFRMTLKSYRIVLFCKKGRHETIEDNLQNQNLTCSSWRQSTFSSPHLQVCSLKFLRNQRVKLQRGTQPSPNLKILIRPNLTIMAHSIWNLAKRNSQQHSHTKARVTTNRSVNPSNNIETVSYARIVFLFFSIPLGELQ